MRTILRNIEKARMAVVLILAMLTVQNTLAATKQNLAAAIGEGETYIAAVWSSPLARAYI